MHLLHLRGDCTREPAQLSAIHARERDRLVERPLDAAALYLLLQVTPRVSKGLDGGCRIEEGGGKAVAAGGEGARREEGGEGGEEAPLHHATHPPAEHAVAKALRRLDEGGGEGDGPASDALPQRASAHAGREGEPPPDEVVVEQRAADAARHRVGGGEDGVVEERRCVECVRRAHEAEVKVQLVLARR